MYILFKLHYITTLISATPTIRNYTTPYLYKQHRCVYIVLSPLCIYCICRGDSKKNTHTQAATNTLYISIYTMYTYFYNYFTEETTRPRSVCSLRRSVSSLRRSVSSLRRSVSSLHYIKYPILRIPVLCCVFYALLDIYIAYAIETRNV
jgi:hypothetical protein